VVVEGLDNMWMWGCFGKAHLCLCKVQLKGKRLSSVHGRPQNVLVMQRYVPVCDCWDVMDDVFVSDVCSNPHI